MNNRIDDQTITIKRSVLENILSRAIRHGHIFTGTFSSEFVKKIIDEYLTQSIVATQEHNIDDYMGVAYGPEGFYRIDNPTLRYRDAVHACRYLFHQANDADYAALIKLRDAFNNSHKTPKSTRDPVWTVIKHALDRAVRAGSDDEWEGTYTLADTVTKDVRALLAPSSLPAQQHIDALKQLNGCLVLERAEMIDFAIIDAHREYQLAFVPPTSTKDEHR